MERLVKMIENEQWTTLPAYLKGEIYEDLLERNAHGEGETGGREACLGHVKGGAGQYVAPRPLIQAIS